AQTPTAITQTHQPQTDENTGISLPQPALTVRYASTARHQKRGSAESHHVPRRGDRLQCVSSMRCLEPLLARGRQYEPDDSIVEDLLTPVQADPVEHYVAG